MSARAIAIHGNEMSGERRANLEIKSECPALHNSKALFNGYWHNTIDTGPVYNLHLKISASKQHLPGPITFQLLSSYFLRTQKAKIVCCIPVNIKILCLTLSLFATVPEIYEYNNNQNPLILFLYVKILKVNVNFLNFSTDLFVLKGLNLREGTKQPLLVPLEVP